MTNSLKYLETMSRLSCLILVFFYFSSFVNLSCALNNGFSVELILRDSQKSPMYHPTESKFQRIQNVVIRSINRANHFGKIFLPSTNKLESTLTPNSHEYFRSYSLGTPSFKTYGIMDIGSSLVWLQCLPCYKCYNQISPIFNPSKSSSYKNISCSSMKFKQLKDAFPSCSQNKDVCQYSIYFGGNANSKGGVLVWRL